jgi:hypothetical protein
MFTHLIYFLLFVLSFVFPFHSFII